MGNFQRYTEEFACSFDVCLFCIAILISQSNNLLNRLRTQREAVLGVGNGKYLSGLDMI